MSNETLEISCKNIDLSKGKELITNTAILITDITTHHGYKAYDDTKLIVLLNESTRIGEIYFMGI